MNRRWTALVLAALLAVGCKGAIKSTGDGDDDTTPDVEDEDGGVDVPVDSVPPDVVEDTADDTVDDTVDDTAVDTTLDTADDTPTDPPTDTIGMPCTTDEQCDMGVFCDGDEYCHPSGVCRRSPPPDCDDGDACTDDSCDSVTDACANTLIDGDGDLHAPESCGGDDCDDTVATIYTGATEVCDDGIDQDCDGGDSVEGECYCAPDLTAPGTYSDSTTGLGANTAGTCTSSFGAPDYFHRLVLTSAVDVVIGLAAPGWDGIYYVRESTCDGTELDCRGEREVITPLSLAAGTYYIIVDGLDGGDNGDYTLDLYACATPTALTGNDLCSGAYAITTNGSYGGDNTSFTNTDAPTTCATGVTSGRDAWFSLTLTASTAVHLDTACSEYDTVLYILDGTCTGAESSCDDDSGPGFASELDVTLATGTYYIALDGYRDTSMGAYVLNVSGL